MAAGIVLSYDRRQYLKGLQHWEVPTHLRRELPSILVHMTSLETFKLSCRYIEALPIELWNRVTLVELRLDYCYDLTTIPDDIEHLKALRTLRITAPEGKGSLTQLPDAVGNLASLETLNLTGMARLTALPETIGNARKLQDLILTQCRSLTRINQGVINTGLRMLVPPYGQAARKGADGRCQASNGRFAQDTAV
jgi:hypothetical protein